MKQNIELEDNNGSEDDYELNAAEFTTNRSGAVRNKEFFYLIAGHDELDEDEIPNTFIITYYQKEWGHSFCEWSALSVCVCQNPKEQMIAIGEDGNVYILGSGEELEEAISAPDVSPKQRGPLREVRNIGGKAYATGMMRQVYRRDAPGSWVSIDGNMRNEPGPDDVYGFESIHGFNEQDIYAVGWKGEIWHFDGKLWEPINSPTNLLLTRVFCAPDGYIYVCGRLGMLIRGRESKWQVIKHEVTEADFWDLQWFNEKLYLSTTRMIYTLEGETIRPVKFDEDIPATCYHLDAADGIMWSIGPKDVFEFNGVKWTRIA